MAKKEDRQTKKPVRTSAAQIRDFSCTGFEAIEQISSFAYEQCDGEPDSRARSFFEIIERMAANFRDAL